MIDKINLYLRNKKNGGQISNSEHHIWDEINKLNENLITLSELKKENPSLYKDVMTVVEYLNYEQFLYELSFERRIENLYHSNEDYWTFNSFINNYVDKVKRPYTKFDRSYKNILYVQGNIINNFLKKQGRKEVEIESFDVRDGIKFGFTGIGKEKFR